MLRPNIYTSVAKFIVRFSEEAIDVRRRERPVGGTDERGTGTQYEGEATSVSEPSELPAVRPTPEDGIVRTTGRFDGTLDGDRDGERRMKRPVEELADVVGTNGRQVPMIVYRLVVGGRATLDVATTTVNDRFRTVLAVFLVAFVTTFYALRLWAWDRIQADLLARDAAIVAARPLEAVVIQARIGAGVGVVIAVIAVTYLARDAFVDRDPRTVSLSGRALAGLGGWPSVRSSPGSRRRISVSFRSCSISSRRTRSRRGSRRRTRSLPEPPSCSSIRPGSVSVPCYRW